MPRFPEIAPEARSPEQQAVAAEIAAGPRGSIRGPFLPLLHAPGLAHCAQALGEYLRFKSSIPAPLMELAICVTARRWTAQYEWFAHAKLALAAGVDPAIVQAIADGRTPANLSADQQLVYDFSRTLHRDGRVDDAMFDAVRTRFGHHGVLDLVGLAGYYSLIAFVLNVAEVPLPAGERPQLAPIAGGGILG